MSSASSTATSHFEAASGLWTVEIDSELHNREELCILPSRDALCLCLAIDSWCSDSRTAAGEQDDGDSSRDVAFCSSLAVLLCFIPEQHGRVVLSSGQGVDLIIPRAISDAADDAGIDGDEGESAHWLKLICFSVGSSSLEARDLREPSQCSWMCGYQGDLQGFINGYTVDQLHDGSILIDYILGTLIAGNVASLQALLMHLVPEPEGGSIPMEDIFEGHALDVIVRHVLRYCLLKIFGLVEPGNVFSKHVSDRLTDVVANRTLAVPLDVPCYLFGLRLKPETFPDGTKLSLQWDNVECSFLAHSIGYRVSPLKFSPKIAGKRYRKLDVFVKAVEFEPSLSSSWTSISICLTKDAVVEIAGKPFKKVEVALKAVELDPENSTYWNNLGCHMEPDQVVQVSGASYKRLDALSKALQLVPASQAQYVWDSIGALMTEGELFTPPAELVDNPQTSGDHHQDSDLNVVPLAMSNQDCFLKSLELCPTYGTAMFHLGHLCPRQQSECFPVAAYPALQKAVRLSPSRGSLQRSLELTSGSIEVLDESLCYRLALEKNYDGLISELINDEPHSIPRFLEVVGDYLDSSSMRKLVNAVEKQDEA